MSLVLVAMLGQGVTHAQDGNSVRSTHQIVRAGHTDAQLLEMFHDTDWSRKAFDPPKVLLVGLGESEALRSEVLNRYLQEPVAVARGNIAELIKAKPWPELIPIVIGWIQEGGQPDVRAKGFQLSAGLSSNATLYHLTTQAILRENDTRVLAAAIWALRLPQDVVHPIEMQTLYLRLHTLTRHADPRIQMASIQRLAEWDLGRRYIEQDILHILRSSANLDTKLAAIGASSIADIRSAPIKAMLFKLLEDTSLDAESRSIMLLHMPRFELTVAEYKRYTQLRSSMFNR